MRKRANLCQRSPWTRAMLGLALLAGLAACAASSGLSDEAPVAGAGAPAIEAVAAPEQGPGPWRLPCQDGQWRPLDLVYLGLGVDYLALHVASAGPGSAPLDERGVACAGATDRRACVARIEEVVAGLGDRALVSTRDERVEAWSLDTATTLLGVIDTPSEAAVMAFLAGFDVACGRTSITTGEYWEVTIDPPDGCGTGYRVRVRPFTVAGEEFGICAARAG